jgi:hypothetical protein
MITLKRTETHDRTIGILTLPDGTEIKTIELKWNNNKVGKSCIKPGIYKFIRDHFGRHQWFSILDVEGRTAIEIHEGYKPSHSQGCILMDLSSLNKMLEFFDSEDIFILQII